MNKNTKIALTLNIVLIVLVGSGLYLGYNDKEFISSYCAVSAILALIASVAYVFFILIKKEADFIVLLLRYIASACLGLTLIGNFYVAIGNDYLSSLIFYLTNGYHLFFNLLCPIVSIVSFIFFEGDRRLNKKKTIYYALIPTVIYGIVMFIFNVNGSFNGPYALFDVNNPVYLTIITAVVVLIIDYLIGRYMLLFNQQHAPRRKRG